MTLSNFMKGLIFIFLTTFIGVTKADNWYQVEVIVFEYLNPDVDGEVWLQDPGMPNYEDVVKLVGDDKDETVDATEIEAQENIEVELSEIEVPEVLAPENEELLLQEGPVAFLLLPEENLRLEGVYRVLKLSRDYKPLKHITWQQPALETNEARAVHLSLNSEVENLIEELPLELAEIQILDEFDEIEEPGEPIFDGFIRIRSSLFLHVDVDINYFPEMFVQDDELETLEISDEGNIKTELLQLDEDNQQVFVQPTDYVRLKESRKIKLNEMHYFDHPMFGVIVQVSRLEVDMTEKEDVSE